MFLPGINKIRKIFFVEFNNFLFSNGDAHLKNFSHFWNQQWRCLLSPAYDLINTRLHVDDSDFALNKRFVCSDYKSGYYKKTDTLLKKISQNLQEELELQIEG
ncbi:MAG: HipA domain-containing protein [Bacteroidia bacterium]